MRKFFVFLVIALGVAYYLKGGKPPKLPYLGPKRLTVTVVSASIPHLDPHGQPWHTKEPSGILPAFAEIFCASYGVPSGLCSKVASAIEGGRKVFPPAVEVDIWVGGNNYSTYPLASFGPQWNYTFALDLKNQPMDTQVRIEVSDADGGRTLGQALSMTLKEFIDLQSRHLNLGDDIALQLKIEPAPKTGTTKTYYLTVPAKYSLKELARRSSQETLWPQGWEAIPVLNGDTITIFAEGEICISRFLSSKACAGPVGWISEQNNLPEFKGSPHAALVGAYGGKTLSLRSTSIMGSDFEIEQPGLLILGTNIQDISRYEGEFDVRVIVRSGY